MTKIRAALAVAVLVGFIVMSAVNVGMAGQRDRLRERIKVLEAAVQELTLEAASPDAISSVYVQANVECTDGTPAIWVVSEPGARAHLSC